MCETDSDTAGTQTIEEHLAEITTGVAELFRQETGPRVVVAQYLGQRRRPGLVHLDIIGPNLTTVQIDYASLVEHYRSVSPGPGLRYEVGALLYSERTDSVISGVGPRHFENFCRGGLIWRVKLTIRVTDGPGNEVAPTTP